MGWAAQWDPSPKEKERESRRSAQPLDRIGWPDAEGTEIPVRTGRSRRGNLSQEPIAILGRESGGLNETADALLQIGNPA